MKLLNFAARVALAACVALILYGWATDCRDTAGVYVYCVPGGE